MKHKTNWEELATTRETPKCYSSRSTESSAKAEEQFRDLNGIRRDDDVIDYVNVNTAALGCLFMKMLSNRTLRVTGMIIRTCA